MQDYQPPYTINPAIVNLIAQISEEVGRLTVLTEQSKQLRLRRINRVRTIHGSLAIEGNQLSEEQVTAILDGKKVIAPPREIQEVRNAIKAYDKFDGWSANNEKDLKKAHQLLMAGLIDEIGIYRRSGVGVVAGKKVSTWLHLQTEFLY
ncbi:MAG: Fic family protein [Desulfovibrio sp.]